jgi:hypothetical protein
MFRVENIDSFFAYMAAIYDNTPSIPKDILSTTSVFSMLGALDNTMFASSKDEIFLFIFYTFPLVIVQVFQIKRQDH